MSFTKKLNEAIEVIYKKHNIDLKTMIKDLPPDVKREVIDLTEAMTQQHYQEEDAKLELERKHMRRKDKFVQTEPDEDSENEDGSSGLFG